MNKEQTPMTAEEFYYKWQTQDFEHKKIEMPNFTEEELLNFGEQFAQAKVLEVLENLQFNIEGLAHDEIYWLIETKVKPKYE